MTGAGRCPTIDSLGGGVHAIVSTVVLMKIEAEESCVMWDDDGEVEDDVEGIDKAGLLRAITSRLPHVLVTLEGIYSTSSNARGSTVYNASNSQSLTASISEFM